MITLQPIEPAEIENESFRIIEAEFEEQTGKPVTTFTKREFKVLQRVIHATGDFSLADSIGFLHQPIDAAINALRKGGNVLTDVNMVAAGVSSNLLSRFGGRVICGVGEPETAVMAKERGITRSEAAMERYCTENIALVAIGNAPTALVSVIRLLEQGRIHPGAVIGVPVGFVNAAESKELLKETTVPAITITGRRGGSPIAAAITNAILRIAADER